MVQKHINPYFVILLSFLSIILIESATYANLNCSNIFESSVSKNGELTIDLSIDQTYINGNISTENLIFMTAEEYTEAAKADQIPINSILILDRLPLITDLPLVSAIIVSKKLKHEDTHIQIQAQKMNIIMIYSSNVFSNKQLRKIASSKKSFELKCLEKMCHIIGRDSTFIKSQRPQSVLPARFHRIPRTLILPFGKNTPRNDSGDKFFNLAQFKVAFPDLVADISSLSSDFFETFLDTFQIEGTSLRIIRNELIFNINKANSENNETTIKYLLEKFRHDIKYSQPISENLNIFSEISDILKKYYIKNWFGNFNKLFSIRSNNGEEDLFTAGLYKSTVINSLDKVNIEKSLREIWSSTYTYRAYSIRRYWGQQEMNLSMPILIHPFIGNVLTHAVGSFTLNPETGALILTVNLVMGNSEKATNPSETAESFKFVISKSDSNIVQMTLEIPQTNEIDIRIKNALIQFFKEVEPFMLSEFKNRRYRPPSINVEFVVPKKDLLQFNSKVVVLQYNPTLNKNTILSILNGEIPREDTDIKVDNKPLKTAVKASKNNNTLKNNIPYRLDELNKLQAEFLIEKNLLSPFYFNEIRYALMTEDQKAFIVIWTGGEEHLSMKRNLMEDSPNLNWIKSGYLRVSSSTNEPLTLIFSDTTIVGKLGPDLKIDISNSQFVFQKAWELIHQKNNDFFDVLVQNNFFQLRFVTQQGSLDMNLTP